MAFTIIVDGSIAKSILRGEGDEEVVVGVIAEDLVGVFGALEELGVGGLGVVIGFDRGDEVVEEVFPGEVIDIFFGKGFAAIDGGVDAGEV